MQDRTVQQSIHQKTTNGYMPEVNVGQAERWLSCLGGGVLTVYALRQSLWGLALIAGGVALVRRGLSGHCTVYQAMEVNTNHADMQCEESLTSKAR